MLPSLEEIGKKRRALDLTQTQLASLAGVSQSLIAKAETKKIDPSYTKVKAIFDALERLETQTEVRVAEVFHDEVIGIQKGDKVSKAVKLMTRYGYSQLPVFEGERVVGSISEKIVLQHVSEGKDLTEMSMRAVEDVMEDALPQVGEDAPVPLISGLLQVYPAVLISKRGKVIGIVTKADLMKMLL
jgi:predicted transcriptional regulator